MNEPIVVFHTAILANSKGFNWPTIKSYGLTPDEPCISTDDNLPFDINTKGKYGYSAPTLSHLHKWLMETQDLYVYVLASGKDSFSYILEKLREGCAEIITVYENRRFTSHAAAFEAGLVQALLHT